ncbi:hypothetical protein V499_00892 [Pseudogymnoascus sp. VKM F-103]|nr:hypothetical protein V499_00892 [Pseudogymnoascus sp. VKM F-103]
MFQSTPKLILRLHDSSGNDFDVAEAFSTHPSDVRDALLEAIREVELRQADISMLQIEYLFKIILPYWKEVKTLGPVLEACHNGSVNSAIEALFYKHGGDFGVVALALVANKDPKIFSQIDELEEKEQTKLIQNVVKNNRQTERVACFIRDFNKSPSMLLFHHCPHANALKGETILDPPPRLRRPRIRRKGFQSNRASGSPMHTEPSDVGRDSKRRRVDATIPACNNLAPMPFYADQHHAGSIAQISRPSPIASTLSAVQLNSQPTAVGISKADSHTNSHGIEQQLASQQKRHVAAPYIHQSRVRTPQPTLPSISFLAQPRQHFAQPEQRHRQLQTMDRGQGAHLEIPDFVVPQLPQLDLRDWPEQATGGNEQIEINYHEFAQRQLDLRDWPEQATGENEQLEINYHEFAQRQLDLRDWPEQATGENEQLEINYHEFAQRQLDLRDWPEQAPGENEQFEQATGEV